MRLLFVSDSIEPFRGASTVLNSRLLSRLAQPEVLVVTSERGGANQSFAGKEVLCLWGNPAQFSGLPSRIRNRLRGVAVRLLTARLCNVIRSRKPEFLLAQFPPLLICVAGIRAARNMGLPWGLYLHDMLVESRADTQEKAWAQELESHLSRKLNFAVISEAMAEEYERKHGVRPPIIPHLLGEPIEPAAAPRQKELLFCGGVYRINMRTIQRLVRIFRRHPDWSFRILTQTPKRVMTREGISGTNVHVDFIPDECEFRKALAGAGVLFSGLDFYRSDMGVELPEIRSILPTKLTDYCLAGRPILVSGDPSYYLTRLIRKTNSGVIVTEDSDEALEAALVELLDHPERQAEWGRRAAALWERFRPELAVQAVRENVDRWARESCSS